MFTEVIEEEKIEIEDNSTPIECFCTTEYSVFNFMPGNRPVSERHVLNLIESINSQNLLRYKPILVDRNFRVIDGQHRLEAAKRLNLHIFYMVIDSSSYKTCGTINNATENWRYNDYLENFSKNGHKDYIKFRDFQDKYNITKTKLTYLLSDNQQKMLKKDFKIGEFRIIDDLDEVTVRLNKIKDIISFLNQILLTEKKSFLQTDSFWKALCILLLDKEIDIERLKEKLTIKKLSISQMSGYKDYLALLTDIYNWKTKKSRIE